MSAGSFTLEELEACGIADLRGKYSTDLHDHHMAIKCTPAAGLEGSVDAATDLGDDGAADCHIGHEVAVHDVDV
mgnify:CR=1 FL=1